MNQEKQEGRVASGNSTNEAGTSTLERMQTSQRIRILPLDGNPVADAKADATKTRRSLIQVEVFRREGFPDRRADEAISMARELGCVDELKLSSRKGFLIDGELSPEELRRVCDRLLVEPVVEGGIAGLAGATEFVEGVAADRIAYVLPRSGVTDPEAESALWAMREMGLAVNNVRTFRRFTFSDAHPEVMQLVAKRVLFNDSIEELRWGPLGIDKLDAGATAAFEKRVVPLTSLTDDELVQLSREGQLSLSLVEMQTIQAHYRTLHREPTDIELETIAQTWSEHCSHKTLAGRVDYDDGTQQRSFTNMLKETIFSATQTIRARLGDNDWCVSVFKDNAGIIRFNDDYNVTFKVETHNRPSAIEPYGGANTGLGGVIRDTMGTGLGAKPICSTDVFCFADPDCDFEALPPGVMHPRRIINGVVSGVRDYGNRMGIPTVNGAVYFDERYIGNPLVFCGNVGLIPQDKSSKEPQPNDLIVVLGGRTGRDGIHGATFSSAELTESSEKVSSGAVQIGNAIVEKMVLDVMLQARDRGLYHAVTDCGAGGFSSAVGEMGESIGAEVWLERAPLKYAGLTYTEIWISEAQERMVFAVPESKWPELEKLCQSESVEATVIGRFTPTGKLTLKYNDQLVGELAMDFLHDGRPPVRRSAIFRERPVEDGDLSWVELSTYRQTLHDILASPNVASKHWIIRQYDHEVLAGSVVKPLVGVNNDGPSDAAVICPVWGDARAIAVACGMNPLYGDLDPYHMAASSIDEAVRNCVAVGADPERIGILDNFCWGDTDRPETLGNLVRAALACQDVAIAFGTPFISGKDSLKNEFSYSNASGQRETITIPSTLLISALGQVPDAHRAVTMDLKSPGNRIYLVGKTGRQMGGSHALLVNGAHGQGHVPTVNTDLAKSIFHGIHQSIGKGLVRSCHDLSEGGLAVAIAEMCFAGGLGAHLDIGPMPTIDDEPLMPFELLFSESNSRFVCEVEESRASEFEQQFSAGLACPIGQVSDDDRLVVLHAGNQLIDEVIPELKNSWQRTLDWE